MFAIDNYVDFTAKNVVAAIPNDGTRIWSGAPNFKRKYGKDVHAMKQNG